MRKLALILSTLIFLISFFKAEPVSAAGEFSTSYEIDYQILESGETSVTKKVEIKNLTTKYVADDYKLSLGNVRVTNFSVTSPQGEIQASQKYENNNTTIELIFKNKVVGKDKLRNFTIFYKTEDLTKKVANSWEIDIPKLGSVLDVGSYNVKLTYPDSFGKALSVTPKPNTEEDSIYTIYGKKRVYNFSKDQLSKTGIQVIFGQSQNYGFVLNYKIKNDEIKPSTKEIILPKDTPYQKVFLKNLSPKPAKIIADLDGNWVAFYSLSPAQELSVTVEGNVIAYLTPTNIFSQSSISPENLYTNSDKFWESEDSQIVLAASKLMTAEEIYYFVSEHLAEPNLSFSDTRRGGKEALINPKNTNNHEYSDLFISLARAVKIPAREVDGFISLGGGNIIPHSWIEYWDEQYGWIQIDPSYGVNLGDLDYFTKLDLRHFSLVTHGLSSLKPDISTFSPNLLRLEASNDQIKETNDLKVSFELPRFPIALFSVNGKVVIKNQGNTALHSPNINISIENGIISDRETPKVEILIPKSEIEVPISIRPSDFLNSQKIQIKADIAGLTYTEEFKTNSAYLALVLAFLAIYAITWGVYKLILGKIRKKYAKAKIEL